MSPAWPADTAPPAAATPPRAPAPVRSVAAGSPARPAAAPPGTPTPGADAPCRRRAAGRQCAPPCGRCRGPTGRSPRSRRRASPGRRWRTAAISRSRLTRRRCGQQDPPQPGQEQQPDPDWAIDARQQQVGQPDRGSRATQPVATMSVCACMAATLRAVMTGSIRLHVDRGAGRRQHRRRNPRPSALSRECHAPRPGRHGAAVQRPRR